MADRSDFWFAPQYRGIRFRLMAWGLGSLTAALLINTVLASLDARAKLGNAAAQLQTQVAANTARRVEAFIFRKLERLHDTALGMSIHPSGSAAQLGLGGLLLKNDPAFTELAILNADGLEVVKFSATKRYSGAELQNQRNAALFRAASGGKNFVSADSTPARGEPFLTVALPLKLAPKGGGGVAAARVKSKFLRDIFTELRFGHGGYAYLIDRSGTVIAHGDGAKFFNRASIIEGQAKLADFIARGAPDANPGSQGLGIGGTPVLSTYATVNRLGWAVVVEEPAELALADWAALQRNGWLLFVALLLTGALMILWLSDKIIRPIANLRAAVAIMAHGNLAHRASVQSTDEIGQLAGEFNHLADVLKSSYVNLEQKIEQRSSHMAALYDVTRTTNLSLDLDRVLQEVVERITKIFHCDSTAIYLFDGERKKLVMRALFETRPEARTGSQRLGDEQGLAGQVAATGEALIFDDVQSDPRYEPFNSSRDAGIRFLAMLPIKIHGNLLGALGLSAKDKRILSAEESRLLTSMCEPIAVTVEKVNLFDQVMTHSRQLEVLNTIGATVSQSLNLDEVLDQAVDRLAKALGFDAAWIYQIDHADGMLRMKAFHGLSDAMAASVSTLSVHAGVSGHVIETGEPLVFEDIENDDRYLALSQKGGTVALQFASAAAFPITAKEEITGTLHVANRGKRHLAADEIELIQTIAGQIGVASENAKLFAEVSDKTKALAQTNEELLAATRAKSEFIAAMSHELRTPLNIITGSADLLHDGFFGALNAGQLAAIEKICRNSRVLLTMIDDVLTLSRFDAGRMSLELSTVKIDDIVAQARALIEHVNRDNHLEVRWDIDASIPPLRTDALKLEEILQNLIANAVKFTPAGRIEVGVHNRPELNRVEFTVADTGIGIAAEDQVRIFGAFEQLKEAHTGRFNGVGLGLNIVRRYLDLMQGEISLESQPGQGAKFTFFVPRTIQANS